MPSENLIIVGISVILIGFVLVVIGSFLSATKSKTEVGFVGFIGPFPIGFGTSKNILYLTLVIAIILLIVFLVSNKRWIF